MKNYQDVQLLIQTYIDQLFEKVFNGKLLVKTRNDIQYIDLILYVEGN